MRQRECHAADHGEHHDVSDTPTRPLEHPAAEEKLLRGCLNGKKEKTDDGEGDKCLRLVVEAVLVRRKNQADHDRTTDQDQPDPKPEAHSPPAKVLDRGKQIAKLHSQNPPVSEENPQKQGDKGNQGKKQESPAGHSPENVAAINQDGWAHSRIGEKHQSQKGSTHQPQQKNHNGSHEPPPPANRDRCRIAGKRGALSLSHVLIVATNPEYPARSEGFSNLSQNGDFLIQTILVRHSGSMSDIRDDTLSGFQQIFGYDAHGLWSAPGELSLLGDDSDYADGYVLSIAINRRTAVAAGVRKDRKLRVASTEADEIAEISLDSLEPDAVHGWAAYPLGVAWALGQFGADIAGVPGLDLFVDSDVPVGVGLGSSAALETAIAVALNDAWQLSLDTTTLARVTQRAEKSVVGRTTGLGDHIPSFVAEDDSAILFDSRSLDYDPVKLHMQDAELAILVIDTGIERAEPLDPVRFSEREQAVDAMGIPSLRDLSPKTLPEHRDKLSETVYRRAQHIVNENHRVLDAVKALRNDGVHALGDIIQASQSSLRDDYDASCAEIDLAIETALTNGALGARMIGLGNSGTVYALLDERTVSRVLVGLDGAFAEHGFQVPATYVVGPSRGALRH